MDAVQNRYPCVLCNETLPKDGYESHIAECVTSVSDKMSSLLREKLSTNRRFAQSGEERYKVRSEQCQSEYQDLNYRLQILGYKRCASGFISPIFSKYFYTINCSYCSEGFSEWADLLEHKDLCMRTAVGLKTTLHQTTSSLERDLEISPDNRLIKEELNQMKECLAFISCKLLLVDKIPLDDFSL